MVAPLADVFQAEEASALVCVESEQNSSHPTVISDQERMDQPLFGPAARKFDADRTLGGDRIMRREVRTVIVSLAEDGGAPCYKWTRDEPRTR